MQAVRYAKSYNVYFGLHKQKTLDNNSNVY
jgi:hypothetical protein